jgi:hypothetical protein
MTWDKVYEIIDGFALLGENWDGYGSGHLPKEFLEKCKPIVKQLEFMEPPFAVPYPGGFQVEWHSDDGYLEISFDEHTDEILFLRESNHKYKTRKFTFETFDVEKVKLLAR